MPHLIILAAVKGKFADSIAASNGRLVFTTHCSDSRLNCFRERERVNVVCIYRHTLLLISHRRLAHHINDLLSYKARCGDDADLECNTFMKREIACHAAYHAVLTDAAFLPNLTEQMRAGTMPAQNARRRHTQSYRMPSPQRQLARRAPRRSPSRTT